MLHRVHSTISVREERVCGRGRLLGVVGGTQDRVMSRSRPWGFVYLSWVLVGRHLLGNARGLLRVVHGIEGDRSHNSLR